MRIIASFPFSGKLGGVRGKCHKAWQTPQGTRPPEEAFTDAPRGLHSKVSYLFRAGELNIRRAPSDVNGQGMAKPPQSTRSPEEAFTDAWH
jgi:hypothetical protein